MHNSNAYARPNGREAEKHQAESDQEMLVPIKIN